MWLFLRILYLLVVNLYWKRFLQFIINVYLHPSCGRLVAKYVHVYLYLSTCEYTFDNTCTLLKYFLIPACVLYLLLKYQM